MTIYDFNEQFGACMRAPQLWMKMKSVKLAWCINFSSKRMNKLKKMKWQPCVLSAVLSIQDNTFSTEVAFIDTGLHVSTREYEINWPFWTLNKTNVMCCLLTRSSNISKCTPWGLTSGEPFLASTQLHTVKIWGTCNNYQVHTCAGSIAISVTKSSEGKTF